MIKLKIAISCIFVFNSVLLIRSCDLNKCQIYRQTSEQSFIAGKFVFCRSLETYMMCLRRLSVDCIHNNHVKQVLSRYSTSCLEPKMAYFVQSKDEVESKTNDLYDDIGEKTKKLKKTDDLNVDGKKNKNDDMYDNIGEKLGKEKRTNAKKGEDKDDPFDDFGEKQKDDRGRALGDKRNKGPSRNSKDDVNDDEKPRSYGSRFNAYGGRWNNENPIDRRQPFSPRFGSSTIPSVSQDDDESDDDNNNDTSDQNSDEITTYDHSYKPSSVVYQFSRREENNGRKFLINKSAFASEERDGELEDINLPLYHNPNQRPHFQHPGFLPNMVVRLEYFDDVFDGFNDIYDENIVGMDDLEDNIHPNNFKREMYDDFDFDDDMLKPQTMIRHEKIGINGNVNFRNDVDSSSEEDWPTLADNKIENHDSNEFFGDGSFEDDDRNINFNFKLNNTKRFLSSSIERTSEQDIGSNENTLITGHSLQTFSNQRQTRLKQSPPDKKHLDISRQPTNNFPTGLQFMSDNIPLSQKMGIVIDKKPDQIFVQRSKGFSPPVRRERIFQKGTISKISNDFKNNDWLFSDNTIGTEAVTPGNTNSNSLLKQTLKEDGGRLFKSIPAADNNMLEQTGVADSNSILNTLTQRAESNNILQHTPTVNKIKMFNQTMATARSSMFKQTLTDDSSILQQQTMAANNSNNILKPTLAAVVCLIFLMFI